MIDFKKNLYGFMSNYPGSFVGCLNHISEILSDLGKDWKEYGKAEWGNVFITSGEQIKLIASNLAKIEVEYTSVDLPKESTQAKENELDVFKNKIEKMTFSEFREFYKKNEKDVKEKLEKLKNRVKEKNGK